MNPALTSLLAASIAFVGTHFAMSHPLRGMMVRLAGDKGFLGLYSLVSFATFGWMIVAFRASPPGIVSSSAGVAAVVSLLTLVAMVLFAGSLFGNPALPDTPVEKVSAARATGVFCVTRHPMMWGFALWAVAHILLVPNGRTLIVAGAILILALLGAHLQDRKKEALLGTAWQGWARQTRFWPQWHKLAFAGWKPWVGGGALWLAATWAHGAMAGIPAGLWPWLD
ncbi:MAG: MFS transporter [Novosphingobium sp.]|nr:MFS transporter [Novosphingobium sp.]